MSVRKKTVWIATILVAVFVAAGFFAISQANISALPKPGGFETSIATPLRNWLIRRAASGPIPPAPPATPEAISQGANMFGMACATCHGQGGRHPTAVGGGLYPRAADLASPAVQELSDRELFWVIKNGIRMTGMPGFGRTLTNNEIWQLVDFVRSLPNQPQVP